MQVGIRCSHELTQKGSSMKKGNPVIAAMAVLLTAGFAAAQEAEQDDVIAADVARVVEYHVFYSIFDIVSFDVSEGDVVLKGFVTHPYKKTAFEKAILNNVDGVKEVTNEIEVLPPSVTDDRLRYAIASNIYGDDRLLRYAISGIPKPIHIIVRNGYVTLEGLVANEFEKKIIEADAREIGGSVSVTSNLRIENE